MIALASLAKKYSTYTSNIDKKIYQIRLVSIMILSLLTNNQILSFRTLSLGLHMDIDSPSGAAIRNSAEVFLDAEGVAWPDVIPK